MTNQTTSPAWRDLLGLGLSVVVFWLLAQHWELSEKLAHWMQSYEHLQLDEMPLALLLLCAGLAWFAFRRVREVQQLLAGNRQLTQRLMTAQEDERRLLAQELHDEVGQVCTALRIEATFMAKAITQNPSAALEAAQRIDQSSLRMHSLVRDMLKRLRPPNLDSLGFEESIQELCRSWQTHCHIQCHVVMHGLPDALPDALSTALYRVTQEALTNVVKHARATQVWVSLHASAGALTLSITDNGRGLQPEHTPTQGLGLTGMRERLASLQGHLHLEDAQPGLRIHAQLPLPEVSP
jgi:glucose-6-phosphate-specific signal transduction histidine kinase